MSAPIDAGTIPLVPAQPTPTKTLVSHVGEHTAIARKWRPGDTQDCRLCGECDAKDNMCLVHVNYHVPAHQAKLHSTCGIDEGSSASTDRPRLLGL